VPTKAALSLSSSSGQERENITKGSWVKIRTGRDHSPITVTNKTDSTWGSEFNLLPIKSEQDNETKPNLKTPSPHPSLLPGLNFTHVSLPPTPKWHRRTGNGGCGQFITHLCRSFLLGERTPHTLQLLQHELLQYDSFPWAAVLHKPL